MITPSSESDTRWAVGLLGNSIVSTFACEKYALVPDPARFQTAVQYEFIKRYGNDYLFLNKLFLPFGLTFDQYTSRGDVSGSSRAIKSRKCCSASSYLRTRKWPTNMGFYR